MKIKAKFIAWTGANRATVETKEGLLSVRWPINLQKPAVGAEVEFKKSYVIGKVEKPADAEPEPEKKAEKPSK